MDQTFYYNCETCNYHTNDNTNYNKHVLTRKHARLNDTELKLIYVCELCDHKTSDYSNFLEHGKSKKHKAMEKNIPGYMVRYEQKEGGLYDAQGWIYKKGEPPLDYINIYCPPPPK